MMKKLILILLMASALFACESDEISELDKRVDELEQRLEEIGLDKMVEDLAALKQKVDELDLELDEIKDSIGGISDQIEEIQAQLDAIREELENGSNEDVYWGDVLSDDQFATIATEGYTKITGQVKVRSVLHVNQLSKVEFIGGNFTISNVITPSFPALEVVSGNIVVSNITTGNGIINFPKLNSIGGSFVTEAATVNALQSIEMPTLVVVGGDFKVSLLNDSDNPNIFASLNTSLSVVGGDFGLYNANELTNIQTPVSYIGGNYTLTNNTALLISQSDFTKAIEIGGSIEFTDNYASGGASTTAEAGSLVIFDNLTVLGGNILLTGSQDVTKLEGFSSLTTLHGDLNLSMYLNTLDNFFNELVVAKGDVILWTSASTSTASIIDGFDHLHTIEGTFMAEATEIYGFEELKATCYSYGSQFKITATRIPSFKSLEHLKLGTTMYLVLNGANYNNIMPLFTMNTNGYVNMISLNFTFLNEGDVSFNGLKSLTKLANLTVYHETTSNLSFNALNSLSTVGWYQNNENFVNLLCSTSEMDYSSLQTYFKAKGDDYLANQQNYNDLYKQYVIDSTAYASAPDGTMDEPYPPYYYENMSESISLYRESYWDQNANEYMPYINYAEEKMNTDSDIPALIQAFIHFGKMEASDFGL